MFFAPFFPPTNIGALSAVAADVELGSFTAAIASGSDSGISNSDGITNEPRPELSINDGTGWIVAGMRVQMRINGGSPVALTDGDYHILVPDDFPGPWYLGYDDDLPEGATVELRIGTPDGSEYEAWTEVDPLNLDYSPPAIVSLYPDDNDTGVSSSSILVASFDEPLYSTNGVFAVKKTSDNTTVESFSLATGSGDDGGTIAINTDELAIAGGSAWPSEELYVQQTGGTVTDAAGNAVTALNGTTAWSFTVAEPPSGITITQQSSFQSISPSFTASWSQDFGAGGLTLLSYTTPTFGFSPPSTLTVGGNSFTKIAQINFASDHYAQLWIGTAPSGTQSVVTNGYGTTDSLSRAFLLANATGSVEAAFSSSAFSGTSASIGATVGSNEIAILLGGYGRGSGGLSTYSWSGTGATTLDSDLVSNVTDIVAYNTAAGSNTYTLGGADGTGAGYVGVVVLS